MLQAAEIQIFVRVRLCLHFCENVIGDLVVHMGLPLPFQLSSCKILCSVVRKCVISPTHAEHIPKKQELASSEFGSINFYENSNWLIDWCQVMLFVGYRIMTL